jgi:8-oxo-dGTP diphosphatase
MPRLHVAVKVLAHRRGRVLLLTRSTHRTVAPADWDTPGGRIRFGETIDAALRREIREELGPAVTFKVITVLNVWSFMPSHDQQIVGITFVCTLSGRRIALSAEHARYRWMDVSEAIAALDRTSGLRATLQAFLRWQRQAKGRAKAGRASSQRRTVRRSPARAR